MSGTEPIASTGRVHPIATEIRPLQLEVTQARTMGLRDGQIIQGSMELRGESLKLLLNGQLLDLPPGLRFRPGDPVWLKAQSRAGGWWLRLIDPRRAAVELDHPSIEQHGPSLTGEQPAAPLTTSRLQALLLRPPMPPTLMSLFEPKEIASLLKSASSEELVSLFLRMRVSISSLSPVAVQSAVLSSGLWLESMLARGEATSLPDVKTLLRRLIRALGERDSPHQASLQRAIDDIEAAQVESLSAKQRGELAFALVIPFANANPAYIDFFQSARRRNQKEAPPFTVNIHMDHHTLGEMWLKMSFIAKSQIDLIVWAIKPETAASARKKAGELTKVLRASGLTPGLFRVFNSARPSVPAGASPPGAMLDVQA
jgi:hypothetical protein